MINLARTPDVTETTPMKRLPVSVLVAVGRLLVAVAALVVLGAASAAPVGAGAESTTTTVQSPIKAGAKGTKVGQATLERTRTAGAQTLTITLSVPGGIAESHVCLSDQPFTQRVAPGQCPYAQGATGTKATYVIDLGTRTDTVYVQAHVVTGQDTAYAGWQPADGNASFYGNVAVADPGGDGTPVPVGAIGVLALSGMVAGGLALRLGARR